MAICLDLQKKHDFMNNENDKLVSCLKKIVLYKVCIR